MSAHVEPARPHLARERIRRTLAIARAGRESGTGAWLGQALRDVYPGQFSLTAALEAMLDDVEAALGTQLTAQTTEDQA